MPGFLIRKVLEFEPLVYVKEVPKNEDLCKASKRTKIRFEIYPKY